MRAMQAEGPANGRRRSLEALIRADQAAVSARNAAAKSILVDRDAVPTPEPMPFVVGVPRSGTTLMRNLLDGHADLAIPLETHFIPDVFNLAWHAGATPEPSALRQRFYALLTGFPTWADLDLDRSDLARALGQVEPFNMTDGLRAFYRLYAVRDGKERAGDKTPTYLRELPVVEALLPEAHFIHVVRDGRDCFLSARDAPWEIARNWFPYGRDAEALATQWCRDILLGRRLALTSSQFLEVRYEDLLSDTEAQLKRVCNFISLSYDDQMLRYRDRDPRGKELTLGQIDRSVSEAASAAPSGLDRWLEKADAVRGPVDESRAHRWRREMPPEDVEAFEAVAGDVLERYDYELITRQPSP
jgi:hypothetical protein